VDAVTEFESQVRSMYEEMARISIEPVRARFFDFGVGRMPSFLTKLAGNAQQATGSQHRRSCLSSSACRCNLGARATQ
jgi:hypothetical protein